MSLEEIIFDHNTSHPGPRETLRGRLLPPVASGARIELEELPVFV